MRINYRFACSAVILFQSRAGRVDMETVILRSPPILESGRSWYRLRTRQPSRRAVYHPVSGRLHAYGHRELLAHGRHRNRDADDDGEGCRDLDSSHDFLLSSETSFPPPQRNALAQETSLTPRQKKCSGILCNSILDGEICCWSRR